MSRRGLLAAGLALGAAGPALAAAERPRALEARRVFPFLDIYLRLPAAERSRFALAYYVQRDGRPAAGVRAWIEDGDRDIPIPIAADGRIQRLPTLGQLTSGAMVAFTAPQAERLKIDVQTEATVRPAAELPAAELVQALDQAERGTRLVPALFRMAIPDFERAVFEQAAGGELVRADGGSVALPVVAGAPVFDPARHPGARLLRFARPPRRIVLGPA